MVIREWTNLTDEQKQVNDIIANIIHSLDASHLISVVCSCSDTNFKPVITVHECFATLPNKLENLSFIIRKEFLLQYTKEDFLNRLNNRIRQYITDNNYSIKGDEVITSKGIYKISAVRSTYIRIFRP